jgi:hypothetical protein
MAERTPFLLRLDPEVLAALRKWADDDLRSLNGQIEFLLRRSLRDASRPPERPATRREGPTRGGG